MRHPDQIEARARVVELMGGEACRVELANGHRAVGRPPKNAPPPAIGDEVVIAFHPFDLSRGHILP